MPQGCLALMARMGPLTANEAQRWNGAIAGFHEFTAAHLTSGTTANQTTIEVVYRNVLA